MVDVAGTKGSSLVAQFRQNLPAKTRERARALYSSPKCLNLVPENYEAP